MNSSLVGVNGDKASHYSNEFTQLGSFFESDPPVCSIRDKEQEELPNCPVLGATIFYDKDKRFNLIAAGYIAPAQVQGFIRASCRR